MPINRYKLRTTWCNIKLKQLLEADWATRHKMLNDIKRRYPVWHYTLLKMLAPDEAIQGDNTGRSYPEREIPLRNKEKVQVRLCAWVHPDRAHICDKTRKCIK